MKNGQVLQKLTSIETKLDTLSDNFTKIIYALIALVGANIGVKIVGSPLITDLLTYAVLTSSFFVFGVTIHHKRKFHNGLFLFRIVFSIFIFISGFVRTFVYVAGEQPAPQWYPLLMNIFIIVISIILILMTWNDWDVKNDKNAV